MKVTFPQNDWRIFNKYFHILCLFLGHITKPHLHPRRNTHSVQYNVALVSSSSFTFYIHCGCCRFSLSLLVNHLIILLNSSSVSPCSCQSPINVFIPSFLNRLVCFLSSPTNHLWSDHTRIQYLNLQHTQHEYIISISSPPAYFCWYNGLRTKIDSSLAAAAAIVTLSHPRHNLNCIFCFTIHYLHIYFWYFATCVCFVFVSSWWLRLFLPTYIYAYI